MNQYLRRKIWTLNRSGKFRGYLRTVSGYPVTLTDCIAGQPVSLAVDGNTVQDGTPSPDAPVEVQLCGDRTVNLFDVSELTGTYGGYVENGDIYVVDYTYVTGITPEKFLEMTGLQEGDEFTTTANYKRLEVPNSNNGAEYIAFMPSSSGFNSMNLFNPNRLFNSTIPVGFNSSNYRPLYIYGGSAGADDGGPRAVWSNLAIYKGAYTAETMPAYEPYREPQTCNIYTPQQLAKVGDTADTVVLDFDSNTAKLVNAVGIDDLSALSLNAAWNDVCIFDCKQPQYSMIQGSSGICNRFVCRGGWENTEKVAITNTYFRLFIAKTRIGYTEEDTSDTLVQKVNDWLSENETYGLYSIATPITTDITALQDWDAMPSLWSGTAVITADTVIAPSAITAKYYASKPEEVN